MPLQMSVALRDARLAEIEAAVGAGGTLEIRTGAAPANCAAADSGTVLATISLPADFLSAPSSGQVTIVGGPWQDASADADGVAGHFRIKTSGAVCVLQGAVSMSGGGGEIIVDNTNMATGQPFSITSFTITEGNA